MKMSCMKRRRGKSHNHRPRKTHPHPSNLRASNPQSPNAAPNPRQDNLPRLATPLAASVPMALIDKIFGKKKSLSELNKQELRREEILLTKQRDRLFKRIETISTNKQKIFQQGATQKSP